MSFNTNLCGLDIVYVGDAIDTVLTYEGRGGILAFDKAGEATVGFVDGHVRMVSKSEAGALRWKPDSRPLRDDLRGRLVEYFHVFCQSINKVLVRDHPHYIAGEDRSVVRCHQRDRSVARPHRGENLR